MGYQAGYLDALKPDYIFAIDVSWTMDRCRDIIVPARGEFFKSLQSGDYVSIIKFGGEAASEVGSSGKNDSITLQNLVPCSEHLCDRPSTSYEMDK